MVPVPPPRVVSPGSGARSFAPALLVEPLNMARLAPRVALIDTVINDPLVVEEHRHGLHSLDALFDQLSLRCLHWGNLVLQPHALAIAQVNLG